METETLMEPVTIAYKTVQNCEIRADIYRAVRGPAKSPVIVWIHGGALIMGSRKSLHPQQLRRYLENGYAVASIDYRLAPETKLSSIVGDVQAAFRWVREEGPSLFGIDPDHMAVIGHSAGGYLTLMAGFCVSPRPKALVSFYGYGDIVGDWYTKPDPYYCQQPLVSRESAYESVGDSAVSEGEGDRHPFYLYCRQRGIWPKEVSGYDPETHPSAFVPFCPIRNVSQEYPPTLLLHGDKDTDVPYQQSVMMAEEFVRAGVEHELITIPGGGHGFDLDVDSPATRSAFEAVLAFLTKHLGPSSG